MSASAPPTSSSNDVTSSSIDLPAIAWESLPPFGEYENVNFPPPRDASPAQQERWLRAAAENVLITECGQCHGPRSSFEVEGDFGDIQDLDAVFLQGQLIRCDARHSPVILTMLDRSMPPAPKTPVRSVEIAIVRDVTDLGCMGR